MALLAKLLGVGDLVKAGADILDQFIETPDEKRALETLKERMLADADRLQVEVNKIEAAHRSIFVAGWRPCVGWICAFGIGYAFVLAPLIGWAVAIWAPEARPPQMDLSQLVTLLLAMLGMSGLRTFEKRFGQTTT